MRSKYVLAVALTVVATIISPVLALPHQDGLLDLGRDKDLTHNAEYVEREANSASVRNSRAQNVSENANTNAKACPVVKYDDFKREVEMKASDFHRKGNLEYLESVCYNITSDGCSLPGTRGPEVNILPTARRSFADADAVIDALGGFEKTLEALDEFYATKNARDDESTVLLEARGFWGNTLMKFRVAWTQWANTPNTSAFRKKGYNFRPACQHHDFGYRNARKFPEQCKSEVKKLRRIIDDNLKRDMKDECPSFKKHPNSARECMSVAGAYWISVRAFGGRYFKCE